ncbi:MAG: OmpH family outer membrane protein [Phycisphaerales bacterium]|jgi:Skp family chaperone for outer membrane proteins|nr:OmpH family outer membrane protein [Phycisphaerales bacterium]
MLSTSGRTLHPLIPALLVLIAALAWQAGANSANTTRPPAQPTAVATVDIVTIFDQLTELKDLEAKLEQRRTSSQADLEEVNTRLKTISADLEAMTRGTEDYKNKVKDAMELQAVLKARSEALNQILSIERGSMTRDLYNKVSDAISRISDREGYDVVLFDDSTFIVPENAAYQDVYRAIVTRSLMYRHDSVDITNQVVSLMNSEYTP